MSSRRLVVAYIGKPGRSKKRLIKCKSEASAQRLAKRIVEVGPAWLAIVKEA